MMTVSVRCELEVEPASVDPAPTPAPELPNISPTIVPLLRE